MGFSVETSVSALTVLLQGILSFFSPCVLPLVPLYISYLAGGTRLVDKDGMIYYPRKRVMGNTVFFVLGISAAFFILGLGFSALGQFFSGHRVWFARISGILMILFGMYQFGVFGKHTALEQERRIPLRLDRLAMNPGVALLLGFTFSFAWTPCVGPTLGSVLLMASSSETSASGFLFIGIYTAGFILPFLAVGIFTGTVLDFLKRNQKVVRYTVKLGAALLIVMGIMTLTGFMNGVTGSLAEGGTDSTQTPPPVQSAPVETEPAEEARPVIPAPDFTLVDQNGATHTLSDYQGKTVFLNFWATWCGPCKMEIPDIQALYETYGYNQEELVVLGVAAPELGREGTAEEINAFLKEAEITYPVVMDQGGAVFAQYGIYAYPTTIMIDENGNVYGSVISALSYAWMEEIVRQTMEGTQQ